MCDGITSTTDKCWCLSIRLHFKILKRSYLMPTHHLLPCQCHWKHTFNYRMIMLSAPIESKENHSFIFRQKWNPFNIHRGEKKSNILSIYVTQQFLSWEQFWNGFCEIKLFDSPIYYFDHSQSGSNRIRNKGGNARLIAIRRTV